MCSSAWPECCFFSTSPGVAPGAHTSVVAGAPDLRHVLNRFVAWRTWKLNSQHLCAFLMAHSSGRFGVNRGASSLCQQSSEVQFQVCWVCLLKFEPANCRHGWCLLEADVDGRRMGRVAASEAAATTASPAAKTTAAGDTDLTAPVAAELEGGAAASGAKSGAQVQ